jgi:AraC-like DNA-binding protein
MLHSFDRHLEQLHGFETDYVKLLCYDLPANYEGTYQTYGYTRFCTILEGDKHITLEDRSFKYTKDQSLLLPAYSKVYMEIDKPTKALVFELNDRLIETVVNKLHMDTNDEINISTPNEVLINNFEDKIRLNLQQLLMNSNTTQKEPFLIDLHVQKLIYDLLHMENTSKIVMSQNINPMDRAIKIMHQSIGQPFSTQALAETLNMSLSNFSHTFKKNIGIAPNKYMQQLKLEHAQHLLLKSSVTEVAFELGFENPSYFIRLFKEGYGITPKQYQLRHRKI